MATKTFSGRADASGLAYADALTRERFGLSFGQYCSSILIDAIQQGAELPDAPRNGKLAAKRKAVQALKGFSLSHKNAEIGHMTDAQIADLIASRYE